jgi:hypothetical protein
VQSVEGGDMTPGDWEASTSTFGANDQGLGDPMYLDLVQWEDLFSGISSSSSSSFF